MATKRWLNHLTAEVPSDVDPGAVVAVLHDHNFLLKMGNKTFRLAKRESATSSSSPASIAYTTPSKDNNSGRVATTNGDTETQGERVHYEINDEFTVLPGGLWKQQIKFTAWFENRSDGLVTHFKTPGGLVSRTVYAVHKREEQASGTGNAGPGGSEWILDENIESSCNFLLKPFVEGKMVSSRREAHGKIFAEARTRMAV